MREAFHETCSQYDPWNEQSQEIKDALVRRMERSCFNRVIHECILDGTDRLFTEKKFVERYSSACCKLLSNIDVTNIELSDVDVSGEVMDIVPRQQCYMIDKIISGDVDSRITGDLSSHELCPSASEHERAALSIRQQQKFVEKVSRAYTCYKCGGNETIPIEYQARAADEASSRSIKCINCGYVWRR